MTPDETTAMDANMAAANSPAPTEAVAPKEVQKAMIEIVPQANKGILIDAVAKKMRLSRKNAVEVLDTVLDSIRDLLHERGRVAVKGFGTFERKIRKGRVYKHPMTGKMIEVADKETIRFNASEALNAETSSDVSAS